MPLVCSYCRVKKPYRLANVYWRWYQEDHESVGYKVRYCQDCCQQYLTAPAAIWTASAAINPPRACYASNCDGVGDRHDVYGDAYFPKREPFKFRTVLCDPHMADLREEILTVGERLVDNVGYDSDRALAAWGALGDALSG